jgi:hypothetical protein
MRLRFGCVLISLLLLSGANGHAFELLDFGYAQAVGGFGIENTCQAFIDNFTPQVSVAVEGIRFKTDEAYGAPMGYMDNGKPWDGTLDFRLYRDNGANYPDFDSEILLSSVLFSKVKYGTRSDGWYDYYLYDVHFSSAVTLAANQQYWLGSHLSTNYDRDAIFFVHYRGASDARLSNFNTNYYSGDFSNEWTHDPSDWTYRNSVYSLGFALEVTVIPEPDIRSLRVAGLVVALRAAQTRAAERRPGPRPP